MKIVSSLLAALLLLLLCVAECSALQQSVQDAKQLCNRIGVYSGCSGCVHGSGGTCDWCVDPKDESGRNFQQKVLGAICAPSGKCGTGRVKAAAKLCPTVVNISKESPYTGIKMEKASSVIFSSNQNNVYCNFTRQPWLLDRSVLGSSGGCNNVNAHAESGVGAELGMIAGHCFGNAAVLTYRMKECLKEVQSFACTYNCRDYGVASIGYKKSSCDRFLKVCGGFLDSSSCVLKRFTNILDLYCVADDAPRTTSVTAIRPTSRWEFDYGLHHKYDLPVNCELSDWTDWSTCSEPCGVGSQFRYKPVTKPAAHGGDPCVGSQYEEQTCYLMDCTCNYFDASWSTCSTDCGVGTTNRTRDLDSAHSAGDCDATFTQTTNCTGSRCCLYSSWVNGTCEGACGGTGTLTQTRTIEVGAASFCLAPLSQDVSCTTAPCAINHFAGSLIIDADMKAQLVTWTSGAIADSGGKVWTLCYNATLDEGLSSAFRTLCLNRGPTVSVVMESYYNGIYGGYTPLSWTAFTENGDELKIDKYDSSIFTFRLTDRVNGTTHEFVQCFDNTATNGVLMMDYNLYGPCFGNASFCIIDSLVHFVDENAGMQVGCATTDRGKTVMPYQRWEEYYLG